MNVNQKEFEEYCAINERRNFQAEPIDLYEFIEEKIVGMREDGVKPSSLIPTIDLSF